MCVRGARLGRVSQVRPERVSGMRVSGARVWGASPGRLAEQSVLLSRGPHGAAVAWGGGTPSCPCGVSPGERSRLARHRPGPEVRLRGPSGEIPGRLSCYFGEPSPFEERVPGTGFGSLAVDPTFE